MNELRWIARGMWELNSVMILEFCLYVFILFIVSIISIIIGCILVYFCIV